MSDQAFVGLFCGRKVFIESKPEEAVDAVKEFSSWMEHGPHVERLRRLLERADPAVCFAGACKPSSGWIALHLEIEHELRRKPR